MTIYFVRFDLEISDLKKKIHTIYSVAHANLDSSKNMLLLKNPQFLPNHYETLSQ